MATPPQLEIDADLRLARALPPAAYHDRSWSRQLCERVLARTWHAFPAPSPPVEVGAVQPWNLLPGSLDEPLLITCDHDGLHVLSNACTHRGAMLVHRAGRTDALRCSHRGRTFTLGGRLTHAPGFDDVEGFPRACDHLPKVAWGRFGPLVLASLAPTAPLDTLLDPLRQRLSYLPLAELVPVPELGRDHHVAAGWVLCNELAIEGIHGPSAWEEGTELHLLSHGVLRVGLAAPGEPSLPAPAGHVDHGRRIASYHWWVFPGLELDVYPWGMSTRITLPLGPSSTRIVVLHHQWPTTSCDPGYPTAHDQREHQAQLAAESAARGVRARLYARTGYSATHERAVHHFHRLLARQWNR